jgi:KDO2-lipid IV(A) lauroyltransferase
MDRKRIKRGIKYFFARSAFRICSLIIRFFPLRLLYALAPGISRLFYILDSKHRNVAQESLEIAFGAEKNPWQIKKTVRDCFSQIVSCALELLFLIGNPHTLKQRVSIEGKEYLETALKKDKGVIIVSAHFGNFPLMMTYLSFMGYPVAGIMRHMRDRKIDTLFEQRRRHLGIKTIYSQPREACVKECFRTLRNNELLFIQLDQNFGTGGIYVDFFGRKAATATGPVVLALRTQAPILPAFIVRDKNNLHKIIFEPEFVIQQGQTKQQTVLINIQELTNLIESYIRQYPAQWGWIHRRWKSRP